MLRLHQSQSQSSIHNKLNSAQSVTQLYNQSEIQKKIQLYLEATGQRLTGKLPDGYCHGLALLWVIKMAERQEKWFYHLIKEICEFSLATLKNIISTTPPKKLFISEFEKFINHIDWAHRPENYVHSQCTQTDIDKILDLPARSYDLKMFNQFEHMRAHLKKVFLSSTFAIVSGQGARYGKMIAGHSIGCYFRDNKYWVYHGYYDKGQAKPFHTIDAMAQEIHEQMIQAFNKHGLELQMYEFFYSTHLKTQALPVPASQSLAEKKDATALPAIQQRTAVPDKKPVVKLSSVAALRLPTAAPKQQQSVIREKKGAVQTPLVGVESVPAVAEIKKVGSVSEFGLLGSVSKGNHLSKLVQNNNRPHPKIAIMQSYTGLRRTVMDA
jgi:hypothetical protein